LNVVKNDGSVHSYVIQLETVISGHDGWIYGVHWNPNLSSGTLHKIKTIADICNVFFCYYYIY